MKGKIMGWGQGLTKGPGHRQSYWRGRNRINTGGVN
jgi:hypothetical protein